MNFIYCDAGLHSNVGHHANSCRLITAELKRRGIHYRVFGSINCEQSLKEELGVEPKFRISPYFLKEDLNEVSGWLNAFYVAALVTAEDMPNANDFTVAYWNSGQAAQVMAMNVWLQDKVNERAKGPHVVIELGVDPGVDWTGTEYAIRDPRLDARSILYHYTGTQIKNRLYHQAKFHTPRTDRLHIATFEPQAVKPYSLLLNQKVTCLPTPRLREKFAPCQRCYPVGTTLPPKTVGFIGHQRGEKGSPLITDIIKHVLQMRPQTRFLIQSGENECHWSAEWRQLAATENRVTLLEGPVGGKDWDDVLDQCDLICLPYNDQFRFRYSAIACEAVAAGIPYVCPAQSSMHHLQAANAVFAEQTPYAIGNTIMHALDDYPSLLEASARGASRWAETQGPEKMVDALLELCKE